jgi:prepilin-type N-terminal cleavage/methylation domain-containing protein
MQNKGYTIPELIVVIAVLGLFSIVFIGKSSYALADTLDTTEEDTKNLILVKSGTVYANSNIDALKEEKTKYITTEELMESGYLVEDDDYNNLKIKIDYIEESDSISVEVIG